MQLGKIVNTLLRGLILNFLIYNGSLKSAPPGGGGDTRLITSYQYFDPLKVMSTLPQGSQREEE